jgi:ubiquinone biosynthesis protein COQ9
MTDFDTAAIDHATEFGTDPTRAALLKAILPHVPQEGWSDRAFEAAAREAAGASTSPPSGTGRPTARWSAPSAPPIFRA